MNTNTSATINNPNEPQTTPRNKNSPSGEANDQRESFQSDSDASRFAALVVLIEMLL
jgi:hypothetical protein